MAGPYIARDELMARMSTWRDQTSHTWPRNHLWTRTWRIPVNGGIQLIGNQHLGWSFNLEGNDAIVILIAWHNLPLNLATTDLKQKNITIGYAARTHQSKHQCILS